MKVHQSPAPTHPLSRVSLSQWKLLAPEWEAGLSSEEKKKKEKKSNYSLLPLSCHYWKLTSAQSAPRFSLCQATLWLSTAPDGWQAKRQANYPVCTRPLIYEWKLKILPWREHVLCKQVLAQQDKAGHFNLRLLQACGKFRNAHSTTVAVFAVFTRLKIRISQQKKTSLEAVQLWQDEKLDALYIFKHADCDTVIAHMNRFSHNGCKLQQFPCSLRGETLTGWEEWRTKWLNLCKVRETSDRVAA